jgi:hypothetical protein
MKKYSATLAFIIIVAGSFAQKSNSNSILVRHDTTTLKAAECEWIIRSLEKNDPGLTTEIGKSVSLIILQAIEKGKLKAIDRETNKPIPGKEIFTWQMPVDTVPQFNVSGDLVKYMVIKTTRSSDDIRQVRVFQDWYFDISTGKLRAVIKWIELLEEIHTSYSGLFIGYKPLCRIYY